MASNVYYQKFMQMQGFYKGILDYVEIYENTLSSEKIEIKQEEINIVNKK